MNKPPDEIQAGVPDPWQPNLSVPDPRNAGWIYAGTSAGTAGQLFMSQDWGLTWTLLLTPLQRALQTLLPDPDVAGTLYAVDFSASFDLSVDGGIHWQQSKLKTTFQTPLAALNRACSGGALLAHNQLSLDFGRIWQVIPILQLSSVASGPGCALYALRSISSDAFVAKLAPGGETVLWSTYLGGSYADSAAAIGVDNLGNVYVAGNTSSPDFPMTTSRIGVQGTSNVFLTQYGPNGNLQYSTVIGGEASDTVSAMALSDDGGVYLAGLTDSVSFPVTPGALTFQPNPNAGGWTGFAIRLAVPAGVIYSGNLRGLVPYPGVPITVAAETGGTALFAGPSGAIYRMAADGSSMTSISQQPGAIYSMTTDSGGNVFVASVDSQSLAVRSTSCLLSALAGEVIPGDLIVAKLQATTLSSVFSTRVAGQCRAVPQSMNVGPDGSVTVGAQTYGQFPARNPALATGYPSTLYQASAGVIIQLGPSGMLTYATFIDSFLAQPIATAPDDSVYAGVSGAGISSGTGVTGAGVLHLPVALPGNSMVITGAFNAFNGSPGTPTVGMLLTITGQNLANDWIDLGLNDPDPLPTQLGGVQVLFDGAAGEIMQVAPDHVICVVPWQLAQPDRVTVQVVNGSSKSTPLVLPGTFGFGGYGLLTEAFPGLPGAGSVDGNIRNADGTLNSADNPAAPSSIVTLFASGAFAPGPLQLLWNAPPPQRFEDLSPYVVQGTARPMGPGFVDALWAIDFQIPPYFNPGVPGGPGATRNVIGRVGTGVGVYVK
jgi:uncharacterized protein (TIGR03437 family)